MSDTAKRMITQPRNERDALNRHGVFFKKRVLDEIRRTPGMGVFAEEFGVAFNEPVAIDVIAVDKREDRQLIFVFECKRAYTRQKQWVFFQDVSPEFRLCRVVSSHSHFGHYICGTQLERNPAVCSEGYELVVDGETVKADQQPVYEAANQLCKGFLGFVSMRRKQKITCSSGPSGPLECIFPVLVTTAELRVAHFDVSKISLATGNLDGELQLGSCDWLVLKHPFSVVESDGASDFRDDLQSTQDSRHLSQMHRESILVVNSSGLLKLLASEFRDWLDALSRKSHRPTPKVRE